MSELSQLSDQDLDEIARRSSDESRERYLEELLANSDVADLLSPLGLAATGELKRALSERVELASRNFAMFLRERDSLKEELDEKHFSEFIARLAADPARVLDEPPRSDGAREALDLVMSAAVRRGIDPERRLGAIAIGDIAKAMLNRDRSVRIDAHISSGETTLFEDLFATGQLVAPDAAAALPSKNTDPDRLSRLPAILFAMAFIQIVVDRVRDRLPSPSERTKKRLTDILNKSDRRLLDGMREAQRSQRDVGLEEEFKSRATIFP